MNEPVSKNDQQRQDAEAEIDRLFALIESPSIPRQARADAIDRLFTHYGIAHLRKPGYAYPAMVVTRIQPIVLNPATHLRRKILNRMIELGRFSAQTPSRSFSRDTASIWQAFRAGADTWLALLYDEEPLIRRLAVTLCTVVLPAEITLEALRQLLYVEPDATVRLKVLKIVENLLHPPVTHSSRRTPVTVSRQRMQQAEWQWFLTMLLEREPDAQVQLRIASMLMRTRPMVVADQVVEVLLAHIFAPDIDPRAQASLFSMVIDLSVVDVLRFLQPPDVSVQQAHALVASFMEHNHEGSHLLKRLKRGRYRMRSTPFNVKLHAFYSLLCGLDHMWDEEQFLPAPQLGLTRSTLSRLIDLDHL